MKNKTWGLIAIICAVIAYGFSLMLPAFRCPSDATLPGYHILAMGWAGIIALDPRWYANIAFVMLLIFTFEKQRAPIAALIGGTLAVLSIAPAAGCGGDPSALVMSKGLGIGGFLWVLAIFLAIAGNILCTDSKPQTESFPDTLPENEIKK
jgi:hypothetical protein